MIRNPPAQSLTKDAPVLVTGARGFVGRALGSALARAGYPVRAVSRSGGVGNCMKADLSADSGWMEAMQGVKWVVHLAARVHVMRDQSHCPLAEFRKVNRDGALRVAAFARRAGVERVVFLSSVKVLGESTEPGKPFSMNCMPAPEDPYAISKAEAEEGLEQMQSNGDFEVVIVRPPLVYGPGVGGNLEALAKLVSNGWPLPFSRIDNLRDLVARENLVDLIIASLEHPKAAGKRFLVSDKSPVSTPQLVRLIAQGMNRRPRLIAVPPTILRGALSVFGKRAVWDRLAGNLELEVEESCRVLDWKPKVSTYEALPLAFNGRNSLIA